MKNERRQNLALQHILHLQRGQPGYDMGAVDLHRLHVYIEGYRSCLTDVGLSSDFHDFYQWLFMKYHKPWEQGWADILLEQTHGDHLGALGLFISEVAEYLAQHPHEAIEPHGELDNKQRQERNRILKDLLGIKKYRLSSYLGKADLNRLPAYISGYRACLEDLSLPDDFPVFEKWLFNKNPSMREHGWIPVFLDQAGGDHVEAAGLLLATITQYLTSTGGTLPGGW